MTQKESIFFICLPPSKFFGFEFVETTLLYTPGFIKVKKNIFSFPPSFKYVMKESVPTQTQENPFR
jgi:hypothetical protein